MLRSEKAQWKTIAGQIREVREKFGAKTPLGKRRTGFAEAPAHDEAAIEEALVEREPITVVVSEKGWIRALRGQVADLSSLAFKADDALKIAFFAETTSKLLVFATNGRCYTIEAAKLPGGRGHGEPIRLFIDLEQEADVIAVFRHEGGRKLIVASKQGRGFIVAEDECLGNTRKGKQVLNVSPPDEARAIAPAEGELVAAIGDNRKMLVFPIDQVPEMTRGRGVRLQRHKDGGLSDIKTFEAEKGLTWTDSAGRVYTLSLKELADWRGNRADAGRLAPKGFPKNNKFGGWQRRANGEQRVTDCQAKNSAIACATTAGRVRVGTCPASSITASLLLGIFAARFSAFAIGVITSRLPWRISVGSDISESRCSTSTTSRHSISWIASGPFERLTICLPQRRSAAHSSSGTQALTNKSMVLGKSVLQPSMKRAAPADLPP